MKFIQTYLISNFNTSSAKEKVVFLTDSKSFDRIPEANG